MRRGREARRRGEEEDRIGGVEVRRKPGRRGGAERRR